MDCITEIPKDLSIPALLNKFSEYRLKIPRCVFNALNEPGKEVFNSLVKNKHVLLLPGKFDEDTGKPDTQPMIYCYLTKDGISLLHKIQSKNACTTSTELELSESISENILLSA